MKPAIFVQGMHGLGDCLHQRAVVRQLMRDHTVTLETSWGALYHDLVAQGLILTRRHVRLRTQTKNADREAALFTDTRPADAKSIRIGYQGVHVNATLSQTVLEAMCVTSGVDFRTADYRLPVPDSWTAELHKITTLFKPEAYRKPWLVYRPLVMRPEWRGSGARNAEPMAYAELFAAIRDQFFVISVADLEVGAEWIVGPELKADKAYHSGELTFEALAALFKAASMVFTSSGFGAVLAPAVGTPCINVVGGYELPGCHDTGMNFAPFISIGPRSPCACWSSFCAQRCNKSIDLAPAHAKIKWFVSENCPQISDSGPTRDLSEMFHMTAQPPAPVTPPMDSRNPAYALYRAQQRQNNPGLKA